MTLRSESSVLEIDIVQDGDGNMRLESSISSRVNLNALLRSIKDAITG